MARPSNHQAEAIAAEAAAAGLPQAETARHIAAVTGISERQGYRYAATPQPLQTADQIERLCYRLQSAFQRAEAAGDFRALASLSKQLLDAYHRLDVARAAQQWASGHDGHELPF